MKLKVSAVQYTSKQKSIAKKGMCADANGNINNIFCPLTVCKYKDYRALERSSDELFYFLLYLILYQFSLLTILSLDL